MDTEKKLREIIQSGKPKLFKINGEKKYISKKIINDIRSKEAEFAKEHEGGLLPLAALIPLITGAIAAAGGTAAGIATTVQKVKEGKKNTAETEKVILEKKKLEEELKQMQTNNQTKKGDGFDNEAKTIKKDGNGLYLNPYEGTGVQKYFKELIHKSDMCEQSKKDYFQILKLLKGGCKSGIRKNGNGIYLEPYKK